MRPGDFYVLELETWDFSCRMVPFNWLNIKTEECSDTIGDLDILENEVTVSCSFDGTQVEYSSPSHLGCCDGSNDIDSPNNVVCYSDGALYVPGYLEACSVILGNESQIFIERIARVQLQSVIIYLEEAVLNRWSSPITSSGAICGISEGEALHILDPSVKAIKYLQAVAIRLYNNDAFYLEIYTKKIRWIKMG